MCTNDPAKIHPVNKKKRVIAKIPVVLAELDVQIDVFSRITLPEEALDIKQITKKLKLTQCQLLQTFSKKHCQKDWDDDWDKDKKDHDKDHDKDWDKDHDKDWDKDHKKDWEKHKYPGKFKLFLEGFVRKNIEFSTPGCKNKFSVCGDIRHCTVDVPFSCVTTIEKFNGSPPLPIVLNSKEEFEYFKSSPLPSKFPGKDQLLSGDFSEFNQCSFEYFNELPFCELISSKICELDEFVNQRHIPGAPFEERTFRELSEKMVIDVTLKILQNQQVYVPAFHKWDYDRDYAE
ncbi:MAG TPA: hypothetical protein DEF36_14900 [Desulfotomaculum sp.]|nr:hypothetical protein [Desulfotomaculum sp.]